MRRPNQTGTVVKLSGARRKPYCARVTIGYDPHDGHQMQKSIGCYEDAKSAHLALSEFLASKGGHLEVHGEKVAQNSNLSDSYYSRQPTVADIFDSLCKNKYDHMTASHQASVRSWYKKLAPIASSKIGAVRIQEIQEIFRQMRADNLGSGTTIHVKSLISDIYMEAVRSGHILASDDFSQYIDGSGARQPEDKPKKHWPFSADDIEKIKRSDSRNAHIVLFMIATGVRPNEIMNLPASAFHISEACSDDGTDQIVSYFVSGSKTKAGRNRVIPIHPSVMQYVPDVTGFDCTSKEWRYKNFATIMTELGIEGHTPYDTRDTFASLARLCDMDPYCRKKVMGHSMQDLTDDVYTASYINKLYREVCKIRL